MRSFRIALLLAAPFVSVTAQQVPLRDLPKPSREIEDPFSMVQSGSEFRPGQLLVADGIDAEVTLIDFIRGTRKVLGRKGAGPGEYTLPVGVMRLTGDTVVVLDAAAGAPGQPQTTMRVVKFLPDLTPGTTSHITTFSIQDSSTVTGTMFPGPKGEVLSTSLKLKLTPQGPFPGDTMHIVRFALTHDAKLTRLDAIRTPQSPGRENVPIAGGLKVKVPYFGVVNADAWTAFPDGRVAIIRGTNYTIEFILPDGKRTAPIAIPYERIKLTEADHAIELAAFRKVVSDAMGMIKKTLPPNFKLELEITPPASWPAEYPPIGLIVAYPAPSGHVWVRRSMPSRLDSEHWDVIDRTGKLTARWKLPSKTTLLAVGDGAVYAVRTDEDDLRYVQRIPIPK
ncbi:MAG TPA: hypothetical protein VJR92_12295 [Gemmatimonadaceae bacterium]|nr:hypothetical protein [Gemmatimonadaceae bacterium]